MALKIIGSGFGRTGTRSLKEALETLGFGPTHHMEEIFANPPQVAYWTALASGQTVNWDEVFAGYTSQIDWPGAAVWRELAAAYPEAKVIHSQRPDDLWWGSFSKTIGKFFRVVDTLDLPPHIREMAGASRKLIEEGTFHGQSADREKALAAYHKRAEDVKAAIPADRVLVFDVADGWAPLCAFLGVPVPEVPFPNRNQKGDFWANLGGEPA